MSKRRVEPELHVAVVLLPADEPLRPSRGNGDPAHICAQTTITLHPDDLGAKDKFRQDVAYLSRAWIGTYKSVRANTEGLNGRVKEHHLHLGDPKSRLAHGRVTQTILVALLVTVANDHFLDQWRHTHQPPDEPDTSADIPEIPAEQHTDRTPLTGRGRPPPAP
ncbi:hypothetical protein ACFPOI_40025 [Nonomuraea angiospora]|uniref:Transposase n=1 Tax=Nonomuraea angiospora TaxID=46172 RepID=A0ABR9M4I6_9ACTN|nr:hypothetical protein [Nonomuraea angiospora]MBE1587823.1 hypothetical protein [Nonomuraea angiospora]